MSVKSFLNLPLLKVMSALFLLLCFLCLKESTCETCFLFHFQNSFLAQVVQKLSPRVLNMSKISDNVLTWNSIYLYLISVASFKYSIFQKRLCIFLCKHRRAWNWSVYLPSYSGKCISCFMLRHLMTLWDLNI